MRVFYEAFERTKDESIEADFARIDVTDLSEKDRASVLSELKIIIPEGNYQQHNCLHEEGLACEVTPL